MSESDLEDVDMENEEDSILDEDEDDIDDELEDEELSEEENFGSKRESKAA